MIVELIILLLVTLSIHCLIPNECVRNYTITNSGVCCPIPVGLESPCGYPVRGRCNNVCNIAVSNHRFVKYIEKDIRYKWPMSIFQYMCTCKLQFDGVNCGRCAPGYQGNKCQYRRIVKRRNIMSYTKDELSVLRGVLNLTRYVRAATMSIEETLDNIEKIPKLVSTSIHDSLVFIHLLASRFLLLKNNHIPERYTNHNHKGPGFLTWHRYFMLEWERLASEIAKTYYKVEDFTFPYWDWIGRRSCEVCNNDMIGAAGEKCGTSRTLHRDSIFYNWTETCEYNCNNLQLPCKFNTANKRITRLWTDDTFPTIASVNYAIHLLKYYPNVARSETFHHFITACNFFASFLEGDCTISATSIHNQVHNIVDGTFYYAQTSVNDPLFVLHHMQIDRIFEYWLRRNQRNLDTQFPRVVQQEGHCYECNMVGFLPPTKHKDVFKNSVYLGYDYDSFIFGN